MSLADPLDGQPRLAVLVRQDLPRHCNGWLRPGRDSSVRGHSGSGCRQAVCLMYRIRRPEAVARHSCRYKLTQRIFETLGELRQLGIKDCNRIDPRKYQLHLVRCHIVSDTYGDVLARCAGLRLHGRFPLHGWFRHRRMIRSGLPSPFREEAHKRRRGLRRRLVSTVSPQPLVAAENF
jgi:hypothetical protein